MKVEDDLEGVLTCQEKKVEQKNDEGDAKSSHFLAFASTGKSSKSS